MFLMSTMWKEEAKGIQLWKNYYKYWLIRSNKIPWGHRPFYINVPEPVAYFLIEWL